MEHFLACMIGRHNVDLKIFGLDKKVFYFAQYQLVSFINWFEKLLISTILSYTNSSIHIIAMKQLHPFWHQLPLLSLKWITNRRMTPLRI